MRESLSITLDSPPGITSTVHSGEFLAARPARHPRPARQHHEVLAEVALQGEHPDAGAAPVVGLPATLGETVRRGDVGDVDADHRLAQTA